MASEERLAGARDAHEGLEALGDAALGSAGASSHGACETEEPPAVLCVMLAAPVERSEEAHPGDV